MQCAAENGYLGFTCWVMFIFVSMRTAVRLSTAARPTEAEEQPVAAVAASPKDAWAMMLARSKQADAETALQPSKPALTAAAGGRAAVSPDVPLDVGVGEIQVMARMLLLALTGFLTAGWFLSRALSPWMFMYGGIIFALERLAASKDIVLKKEPFPFILRWSVTIGLALLALVYVTLKIRSKLGG
jgi:hypothetical protein